jgi:hypothetical protein
MSSLGNLIISSIEHVKPNIRNPNRPGPSNPLHLVVIVHHPSHLDGVLPAAQVPSRWPHRASIRRHFFDAKALVAVELKDTRLNDLGTT